ncbi:hypothetical protein [Fibrobacter sp.]|uniref:hypothetical protein n=1 Tax=Fibrobacter sp. TaxID=35828 RepID=UPI003890FD3A
MNFKKIATVISLAAASSFAAWDYYNVPEEHHGEARVRAHYWYNGDFHSTDLDLNARFTVIKGLEVSVQGLGYQLFADPNDDTEKGNGLKDFTAGLKYAFNPNFFVFADANIPIGSDDVSNNTFSLKGGVQWVLPITEQFAIGNEFALSKGFEHDHITPGLTANYGFEFSYAFKSGFTPFTGWVYSSQLTDTKNADKTESGTGTSNVSFWAGASYTVIPKLTLTLFTDIEYGAAGAYNSGYIFQVTYGF